MSVTLASRVRVPAEYVGKARLLRDAIAAEDKATGELITALAARLTSRIRRGNPIPRADMLSGIAHEWRQRVPSRSRLALEISLGRKSLAIREMRVTASEYRPEEWNTTERGLTVFMIGLETGPFRYMFAIHTLAHASLHAIGRRSQRGLDATEAAILHDLRALGVAHHALADRPDGAEFAVPASGGAWRGNVEFVRDPRTGYYDKALAVRTFMADGI
jgi:hypothetical protein